MNSTFDVLVDDEMRTVEMAGATRATGARPQIVEQPKVRSAGWLAMDCAVVLMVLLLPAMYRQSLEAFSAACAVVLSIVLTVYGRIVWRVLETLGPPDRPSVVAVIQVPERLYCPRCGAEPTNRYCSHCGVRVDREYRTLARKLAQYVVQDTEAQRSYLTESVQAQLQDALEQERQKMQAAMKGLERNYVMEIARQRKLIARLQKQDTPAALPYEPRAFEPLCWIGTDRGRVEYRVLR